MQYISPLTIYLIWHPNCAIGEEISRKLFGAFCRDIDYPLDQRLGIPTFFRSAPNENGRPDDISFDEAKRVAIICLVDVKMTLDKAFKNYVIKTYADSLQHSSARFIPVALSKAAYNLDPEIGKLNYIKAETSNLNANEEVFDIIYHQLLHELCKIFIGELDLKKSLPPVKLFISHSKHDEVLSEATEFRNYVGANMQVKTFFDVNDIGYGEDFGETIEKNAGKCVVVVFLSDTFSSREWCRNEIIIAKKNHCPIVVVNAIMKGERRSFPYIGNVPTRKWNSDVKDVVNLALETTLSSFFVKESLQTQAANFNVPYDFTLSTYPELFSIIGIKQLLVEKGKEAGVVLYPDPPLGNEELRLLNEMDDRLTFITPLQLTTFLSYE